MITNLETQALVAQEALRNSPIHDLRSLEVVESENGLRISGSVDSFYHKQLAQEAVLAVSSLQISNVVNVVHVDSKSQRNVPR